MSAPPSIRDDPPERGKSWLFAAVTPNGVVTPVYPSTSGSLSYDGNRDVSKTMSGLVFLPGEMRKFNTVSDQIRVIRYEDGVECPMGFFVVNNAPEQYRVLLDPETNLVSNLATLSFGDRMALLIRSNGQAQTIQGGFDPAQEAIDLLSFIGLPHGYEGTTSQAGDSITWNGDVTVLQKIVQLSTLAGHRNPWMNNEGVVRSVVAQTPVAEDPSIIDVVDALNLEAASVVITPHYLTAPNVVIVTDNSASGAAPITGRWDAPSIAPHSYAQRGYYYTQMVDVQGLRDGTHANRVAKAIGEKNSARTLNFRCEPTCQIDGPSILNYADTLWVVTSYTIDLGPSGKMDVEAEELTAEPIVIQGVLA